VEVGGSVGVLFAAGGKVNPSSIQLSKSIPELIEKGLQGVGLRGTKLLLHIRIREREMSGVESVGLGGGVGGSS